MNRIIEVLTIVTHIIVTNIGINTTKRILSKSFAKVSNKNNGTLSSNNMKSKKTKKEVNKKSKIKKSQ